MYTDSAYLGRRHEDIVDNSEPLVITAVGHYFVNKSYRISTNRRLGRGDYQLLYIAEGKAQFFIDGKEHIIEKGNMALFYPNQPQRYYLYCADLPETYWVHFTGFKAAELLERYNMPKQTITYIGTSADYPWMFKQMIRELRKQRPNYQQMLELQLSQLLLMIERYFNDGGASRIQTANEIERAIHFFDENYCKDIVIEKYTEEHFIKPCWFIKNFKTVTGYTPMQYIVNLRIKKARELLENSTYNISQIAAAVGYGNPLYFSRLFSKHTGMTPTEYRKSSVFIRR